MRLASFVVAATVLLACLAVVPAAGESDSSVVMCVCRCCYQGDCTPLRNVSWKVESCQECMTSLCNKYIASDVVRAKAARLFDSLENNIPVGAKQDEEVDVCEVITVLETATCTGSKCKRSTNLKAECYNKDSPLMKYTIQTFVFLFVTGTAFGLIKNYIPAFGEFNAKYFNY